ncbi:hypothetical protein ACET3Z_022880 [Daucus carota]
MIMRFIWPLCKLCRLIDQAFTKGVKVAVCSTSNEKVNYNHLNLDHFSSLRYEFGTSTGRRTHGALKKDKENVAPHLQNVIPGPHFIRFTVFKFYMCSINCGLSCIYFCSISFLPNLYSSRITDFLISC